MLNSVLSETEKVSVIISDSVEIEGFSLLKAFLKKVSDAGNCNIHFYCYTQKPYKLQSFLKENIRIKFFDYTNAIFEESKNESFYMKIFPNINQINGPTVVFIDDLNRLVHVTSLQRVCALLNQFKQNDLICKLFAVYHSDLHGATVASCIEHYSQCMVTLSAVSDTGLYARATTIHKSKVGKIKKTFEKVKILENFELFIAIEAKEKKDKEVHDVEDPLLGLTFKVSLKSNEEAARQKLEPPFLGSAKLMSVGKIDYIPDENDDFDEEDPDDDLDI